MGEFNDEIQQLPTPLVGGVVVVLAMSLYMFFSVWKFIAFAALVALAVTALGWVTKRLVRRFLGGV